MLSPLDYRKAAAIDMSRVQSTSTRHALDISIATATRVAKRTKHKYVQRTTLPKRNEKSMM